MKYKESMFNAEVREDPWTYLYNSLEGTGSLVKIDSGKLSHIRENVHQNGYDGSPEFEKLLSKRFFCQADVDEKALAEVRYMDTVEERTLRFIVLPTEKCNFRCLYCYEDFEIGKMSLEVQDDIIEFVKRNVSDFTGVDIRWFGGEPLLAIDVIERVSNAVIEICKRMKRRYTASIITNAYLLDMAMYRRLLKCHVWLYQITVDGLKDTHDIYRPLQDGSGTFERIIANLKDIREQDTFRFAKFTIRCNFTSESAKNVIEYIRFMEQEFGGDDRFCFMFERASDWGGDRVEKISDRLLKNEEYRGMLRQIAENRIKPDISAHCALMSADGCVCYANKRHSYVIGADGKLYKCSADFIFDQNHIGYLKNGRMEIDERKEAQWITRRGRKTKKCGQCFFLGACLMACCPAAFLKDKIEDPNALCLYEQEYIHDFLRMVPEKFFEKI